MHELTITIIFVSVLWIAHGFWKDYKNSKSYSATTADLKELARLEDDLFHLRLYLREVACPWKPTYAKHNGIPSIYKPLYKPSTKSQNIIDLQLVANQSLLFISAEAKLNYLQSPEWYKIRNERMQLAHFKCECCGSTESLQCHHITYERLTQEHIDDLAILCGGSNGCHQRIHDLLGYDRTTEYPISALKDLI